MGMEAYCEYQVSFELSNSFHSVPNFQRFQLNWQMCCSFNSNAFECHFRDNLIRGTKKREILTAYLHLNATSYNGYFQFSKDF